MCPAIASLPNLAFRILVVATAEFNGHNNGDISLARPILAVYGIARSGAVQKAIDLLRERDLLIQTRQGGLGQCSLYALPWEALTERHDKLDRPLPKLPDTRFLGWQEIASLALQRFEPGTVEVPLGLMRQLDGAP